jgi:glucose/arabinose dehydrogenase
MHNPKEHLYPNSRFQAPAPRIRLAALRLPLLAVLAQLALSLPAATVWTGPTLTYTQPGTDPALPANQDRLTPNVWLTRALTAGIFNAKTETAYTKPSSPAGTEWAVGALADAATLTYTNWAGAGDGNPVLNLVGRQLVLHLLSPDDIYLSVQFTALDGHGTGGFAYLRSTPVGAANVPPTVTIDSPTNGASFALPAIVPITATAQDADGSVTNVDFFDGATALGSDTTTPYTVTADFYPGVHLLTAVATDNLGLVATSTVVSITVTSTPIANPIAARIPKGDITVELRTVADGMVSPISMAAPDDGSGRLFVHDQAGFVWLVTAAGRSPIPVLDLRTRLVNIAGSYDERGLLGLAVHTNFAQFPYLYTYTSEPYSGPADFQTGLGTSNNHQSVVAEWRLSLANSNLVDLASRREILRVDEPQNNHNSGAMHFGPDGLLYLTVGDGGQANDVGAGHVAGGNAQDLSRILGKMIRLDVDGRNSANGKYGIPPTNPFVGGGGLPEIYAYGLRNPFSHSFDRLTGQLYLADVGQNKVEEVDLITAGGNYGWNLREGAFWFDAASGNEVTAPVRPPPPGMIDPIAQYDHDDGSAIIGGYVYRGTALPALAGRYLFGDWGVFGSPSGRLYYLDASTNVNELRIGLAERTLGLYLKGYGEDAAGELYLFASKPQGPTGLGGVMLKIVPPPASALAVTGRGVLNGADFQTAWTGGVGPFAQQRKLSLNEPVWMNESYTSGTGATARLRGATGFFREVDTAGQAALPLTVTLNGALERPANATAGSGSGILSLDGNTLKFSITYSGLSGAATASHIHGPTNTTGSTGVLIDLAPYNGGAYGSNGTLAGTLVLTDTQKASLLAGRTYVNFHTVANPGGEIRGQIAPVLLQASLLGAYQTSPVNTPASGFGTFMLVGTQLTYTVTFRGLSGPASAGHIHGPAPLGQNAGVMIPFTVPVATAGTVSGTVGLTPAQLAAIVDGQTYVNFHTAAYPGGEIRGQIVAQATAVPLTAWISGLNERPTPLTNSAAGLGLFSLEGNSLAFSITYGGLTGVATAAHLHGAAAASGTAGVQIDLAPFNGGAFGASGAFSGVVALTAAQRAMILNGQTYFNIHTAANPGGEARGQLARVLRNAGADGAAERTTAVVTTGNALGLFALVGAQLDLNVTNRTHTGVASDAHIHGPASASANAGVIVPLSGFNGGAFGASGNLAGSTTLTPATLSSLIDGLTYLNFHTAANPGGEIRGQILP